MSNKQEQLGMNPSTAQARLLKDILFKFAKETPCYHCKGMLTRETFSIEHKVPWLHSENPKELFFDLNNISFSHLSCNIAAGRKPEKMSEEERYQKSSIYNKLYKLRFSKEKRQEKRREQYLRTGN